MKAIQNVWAPIETAEVYGLRAMARDGWEDFEESTAPEYMRDANGAILVKLGAVVVDVPSPLPA